MPFSLGVEPVFACLGDIGRMMESDKAPRVIVLIDAENISAAHWPAISNAARRIGRITGLSCFGDFTAGRHAAWLDICRMDAGEVRWILPSGAGKNATDIALTVAAMEQVHARCADIFCIISSDADFSPLARQIRRGGFRAIGMGLDTAHKNYRVAFDDFVVLQAPPRQASRPQAGDTLSPDDSSELSALFSRLARESGGSLLLSHFGAALKRENPGLCDRLKKGRLRKLLQNGGFCRVTGAGTAIRLEPLRPGGAARAA